MQVLVLGVSHQKGTSAKTGAAYEMSRVHVALQATSRTKDAYVKTAFGFEPAEFDMDPAALDQFKSEKFPSMLDLMTDNRIIAGRIVPVVVGVNRKVAA